MTKMTKKGMFAAVAGTILLLFGCAADRSVTEKEGETGPAVELEYWEMEWGTGPAYQEAVQELVDRFNKTNEQGIHVNLTMIPWEGYYERFLNSVTSGQAPDVCSGAMPQSVQYAAIGHALDLTPILEEWRAEDASIISDIGESNFNFFTYNGQLVGLPFGMSFNTLYYRKDLFRQAGIKELPQRLSEMETCLQVLKKAFPNKAPLTIAAKADNDCARVSLFFMEVNGGGYVTKDYRSVIDSSNNLNAFTYLQRWVREGLIDEDALENSQEESVRRFCEGEACMLMTSVNSVPVSDPGDLDRYGVIDNIGGPNVVSGYKAYSPQAYHGFSSTSHPDEARLFLKWLVENNGSLFSRETGNTMIPIRLSYIEEAEKEDPLLENVSKLLREHGRLYTYPFDTLRSFHSGFDATVNSIPAKSILQDVDVMEALSKADIAFQKTLERGTR